MLYPGLGLWASQTLRELLVVYEQLREIDYLNQALDILNNLTPPNNNSERFSWEVEHIRALTDIHSLFSRKQPQPLAIPSLSNLEAACETDEELLERYADISSDD